MPPSVNPTLLKCDPVKIFTEPGFLSVLFVLFFLDLFDAIGTVVGVAEQGGFYKNGKIPRVKQGLALLMRSARWQVRSSALPLSPVISKVQRGFRLAAGLGYPIFLRPAFSFYPYFSIP